MSCQGFIISKSLSLLICPMKISQDVRDFAAQQGVDEQTALQKGMEQKAVEFVQKGDRLYRKI